MKKSKKDVVNLFYLIFKNKNALNIIEQRSNGSTLNEVGKKINLTRERVRQIEYGSYLGFIDFMNELKLFSTNKENCNYFDVNKLSCYDSKMGDIIFHFMKENPYKIVDGAFYSRFLNKIVYGVPFLEIELLKVVEQADEVFEEYLIDSLSTIYGKEFVLLNVPNIDVFMNSLGFNKYNGIFKKIKYSINNAIEEISENYFKGGINPNNDTELEILKEILKEKYSMSSKSSYSLRARVQDALVCCGPSLFCSKNLLEDNEEAFEKIKEYIYEKFENNQKVYYKDIYEDLKFQDVFENKDLLHGFITKNRLRLEGVGYRRDYVYIKNN